MTAAELRALVIEGLAAANIFTLRDNGWTQSFLDGERDVAFADIDMDSLATMELCIAIEINSGVSILPDELVEIESLNALVARVAAGLA